MMSDYSKLGFDANLQPLTGPKVNTPQSAYGFASDNAKGAVNSYNVKNLRWDKASGGTATLGGRDNGNGLLEVLDETGATIVQANKDGLTITDGNIIVQDGDGTTIIDSGGLVSAANFNLLGTTVQSTDTTTGTVYAPLPGGTLTTPSFARDTNVMLFFTIQNRLNNNNDDFNANIRFAFFIDDAEGAAVGIKRTALRDFAVGTGAQESTRETTNTMHELVSMGTGTHDIVINWRTDQNSGSIGTATSTFRTLSAIILGN